MWQITIQHDPITKSFVKKFGGHFSSCPVSDTLFYEIGTWEDSQAFYLPDDEAECLELITQSLKENKNLILDLPPIVHEDGVEI